MEMGIFHRDVSWDFMGCFIGFDGERYTAVATWCHSWDFMGHHRHMARFIIEGLMGVIPCVAYFQLPSGELTVCY